MTVPVPKIDDRTEKQIAEQARVLLKHYTWSTFVPEPGRNEALVHVFARFADIIIQRLNRVPEKQLLAFLDLLGNSRLPPQPARAPLTFALAAGSSVDAVVPAGTQVAAAPAEGEREPVVFETERELVVTAAQLTSLFVRDPLRDRYADRSAILTEADPSGVAPFQGDVQIEHMLYIGHGELLGLPHRTELLLTLNLTKALVDGGQVVWEMWNGDVWQAMEVVDGTPNLTQVPQNTIKFGPTAPTPISRVNGLDNRWLRCRLRTPITPTANAEKAKKDEMVHCSQLPSIQQVNIQVTVDCTDLPIEAAFANLLLVDPSKAFYPFGEKPALGDTLYLARSAAFSQPGAKVTLHMDLNPNRTLTDATARLRWEIGCGNTWIPLGESSYNSTREPKPGQSAENSDPTSGNDETRAERSSSSTSFEDNTKAFTQTDKQTVTFTVPENIATTVVNGIEAYWIRVRIISGNYGREAHYVRNLPLFHTDPEEKVDGMETLQTVSDQGEVPGELKAILKNKFAAESSVFLSDNIHLLVKAEGKTWVLIDQDNRQTYVIEKEDSRLNVSLQSAGYVLIPATFDPPSISSISVAYSLTKPESPEHIITYNDFEYKRESELPFSPFRATKDENPSLYFGFTLPSSRSTFPNRTTSVYLQMADIIYTPTTGDPLSPPKPDLRWEYWNGQGWMRLVVQDGTQNLAQSGLVQFLAPADFAASKEFGLERYWLRLCRESGEDKSEPKLERVLLNTTTAAQAVTIRDEILGASDGSPKQAFQATHTPILKGPGYDPQLEVQEPAAPGSPPAAAEQVQGTWVAWSEVPDFYASDAQHRHYVLDHLSGEIRFGDGAHGRIPPSGSTIRLVRYRTGGGAAGNRPAGTITQLKTSVPYVEGVTNWAAAAGGAAAETIESLYARAPRTLRHGGRAVTRQDYEDLARLASPEVARAQCVPLQSQPAFDTTRAPGAVTVVIVPRSKEARPLPGSELVRRVREYLQAHSAPTVEIHVVGPLYLRADVSVEIVPTSLEAARRVEQAVVSELAGFLHPLTGGKGGTGWAFGRLPERSELYAQLGAVPGVDHIRSLEIEAEADDEARTDSDTIRQTGRFLIYSGRHSITMRSDDATAAT